MNTPPQPIIERIQRLVGSVPSDFSQRVGGYTPASRWTFRCQSGVFFAKFATTPTTVRHLHREAQAYGAVRGAFMPILVAWEDDDQYPMLIIENLSQARWPPPWTPGDIDRVLEAVEAIHTTPASLPGYSEIHPERDDHWAAVAANPLPFLSLGLVTPAWLEHALPILLEAQSHCSTEGDRLAHFDIRSDNICIDGTGARLVDWAEACIANPTLDLGFWLPSLASEGGPLPEAILPGRPEVAAWVSGYFASRAGLPLIPDAPRVRIVQRQQLETALPWAIRELGLPALQAQS